MSFEHFSMESSVLERPTSFVESIENIDGISDILNSLARFSQWRFSYNTAKLNSESILSSKFLFCFAFCFSISMRILVDLLFCYFRFLSPFLYPGHDLAVPEDFRWLSLLKTLGKKKVEKHFHREAQTVCVLTPKSAVFRLSFSINLFTVKCLMLAIIVCFTTKFLISNRSTTYFYDLCVEQILDIPFRLICRSHRLIEFE